MGVAGRSAPRGLLLVARLLLYGAVVIGLYLLVTVLHLHTSHTYRHQLTTYLQHIDSHSSPSTHPRSAEVGSRSAEYQPRTVIQDPATGILLPGVGVCAQKDLFLLVYVHSAVHHFANRALIRATWANPNFYPGGVKIQVVFMLGHMDVSTANSTAMADVRREIELYQDTVVFPFADTYKNTSTKALLALELVAKTCFSVPFVLKTDDDVVVNMFSVVRLLQKAEQYQLRTYASATIGATPGIGMPAVNPLKLLLCHVWVDSKPNRDKNSKWYISKEQYPLEYYPNYCSGMAWIMSLDVVRALYNASQYVGHFPFDDTMVTGTLASRAGIQHLQISHHCDIEADSLAGTDKDSMESIKDMAFFHAHNHNVFQMLWNAVLYGPHVDIRPVKVS